MLMSQSKNEAIDRKLAITYNDKLFRVHNIKQDGNCFYASVSDQLKRLGITDLKGNNYTQEDLRQSAIDYINFTREQDFGHTLIERLEARDELHGDLPSNIGNIEDYINYIRTDGTWTDSIVIRALAQHLGVALRIYDQNNQWIEINNSLENEHRSIYLRYTGTHYDSLVITQDELPDIVDSKSDSNIEDITFSRTLLPSRKQEESMKIFEVKASDIEKKITNLQNTLENLYSNSTDSHLLETLKKLHRVVVKKENGKDAIESECADIIKSINTLLSDSEKNRLFSKAFTVIGDLLTKIADLTRENNIALSLENYNEAAMHYDYAIKTLARSEEIDFKDYDKSNYYKKLYELNNKIINLIGINSESSSINYLTSEEVKESSDNAVENHERFIKRLSHQDLLGDLRAITKENLRILQDSSETEAMSDDYISKGEAIFDNVAENIKEYFAKLVTESIALVGEGPCKYSVVGLGSLALHQITPYSDIEFAIITANNDYKTHSDFKVRDYFKHLSHYLNFKVICLGESIIKTSTYDVNLGYLVNRAINFDLGGKTSLGRPDKDYDLIATVDEMIYYMNGSHNQRLRDESKQLEGEDKKRKEKTIDDKLERILQTSCYICGDKSLLEEYQSRVSEFLLSPSSENNPIKNCEFRAVKLLLGDEKEKSSIMEEFGFNAREKEGQIFDVKQQIYRIPDRFIYNLSVLYLSEIREIDASNNGIDGLSASNTINSLASGNMINQEALHNLKAIMIYANILRFRTYSFYNYQKESIDITPLEDNKISENFRLNKDEINEDGEFFKFYYSAIALTDVLKNFAKKIKYLSPNEDLSNLNDEDLSNLKNEIIRMNNFYDDSLDNKGQISIRLMLYKNALGYYENYLLELSKNEEAEIDSQEKMAYVLHMIGYITNSLGNNPQKALDYYQKSLDIFLKIYGPDHKDVAASYGNLGNLYQDLGEHKKALDYFTKSLEIDLATYGPDHKDVAMSYNNLGSLYRDLGKHEEALYYLTKSLKIYRKTYGPDHKDVTTIYNNLGWLYQALGEYKKALDYHTKSLDIFLKIYGPDHPHVARSYNNLGGLYKDLEKHDLALENYNKSLDISRKTYGPDHPLVATTYSHLGGLYHVLGEHEKALDYHTKSLDIFLKIYGPDHHDVATSYDNLGSLYQALGKHEGALDYHTKSLDIFIKTYGPDHKDVATSYNNLGSLYKTLGKHEGALDYHTKSLDIFIKTYGPDHKDVATSYNNLGLLYQDLGEYEKAQENYNKSLEIDLATYGPDHKDVADSYCNLGGLSQDLGKYEQALDYHTKSLDIRLEIYGPDHKDVATSYNNLGSLYQALGKHEEALENYNKSLDINVRTYGPDHPDVANSYDNLGSLYQALGKHEEALDYLQKSLEIDLATYGPDHKDVATSYNNLGSLYQALGKHEEALENYNKSLYINVRTYGPDHKDVAASYNNLGGLYHALGEHEKALDYLTKSLEIDLATYGPDHKDVAISYGNLGSLYKTLGKHEEALAYHKQSLDIFIKTYGPDHHDVATCYNNLGELYKDLGRNSEALDYFTKSLYINVRTYGPDHKDVANSYNNLGSLYYDLGQQAIVKSNKINYYKEFIKYGLQSCKIYQNMNMNIPNNGIITALLETKTTLLKETEILTKIVKRINSLETKADKILEAFEIFNQLLGIREVREINIRNNFSQIEDKSLNLAKELVGMLKVNNFILDKKSEYCSRLYNGLKENNLNLAELDEYIKSYSKNGALYYKQNDYLQAQISYETDIAIKKAIFGKDSREFFNSVKFVKMIYDRLSDEDKNSDWGLKWQNMIEFTSLSRPIANFKAIPVKDCTSVRVVSYNITADFFDNKDNTTDGRHKWDVRSFYVKKILSDIDADVICLQELSPAQALELKDYFASNYNSLFLSQTPSDIKPTGLIVLNDEVRMLEGLNCGTPLIGTFVKKCYQIGNDEIVSGRFWLNGNPDEVPVNDDRGVTDKGFGNMNTYRAVLWSKVIETQSNKHFFVFNSHYPLSGDSATRTKCAEVEMKKIEEITNGSVWVSVGDKNLIDRGDSVDSNKNHVYKALTSIGMDGRDHEYGRHYGVSGSWLGFSYDKEKRDVESRNGDGGDVLDVIVSNAQSLLSFHHPVGFNSDARQIIDLEAYNNSDVMRELNEGRYFGSDHCLIGVDLDLSSFS